MNAFRRLFIALDLIVVASATAQTPDWIWFNKTTAAETRFFRKAFTVDGNIAKATLTATADDALEVFLNGERVLTADEWQRAAVLDVTAKLRAGANALAIRGRNGDSSPAGVIAQLEFTTDKGKTTVVSDASWKAAVAEAQDWMLPGFNDTQWGSAGSLGKLGVAPWGNVFGSPVAAKAASKGGTAAARRLATPAEALHTLPGFKVELLTSGEPEEGSWVALAKDQQGRLILSPQWGKAQSVEEENRRGLLRLTLGADGRVAKREFIAQPLYDAQGLLWAYDSLWVVVNRYSTKFESGLYRVRDRGNDRFEDIQLVKKLPGNGEHGPHAVELGPDGKIYLMAGNHTKLPEGIAPNSPHRNYREDHLLPRQWDGNGHATGVLAPGGYVLRTDRDAQTWELFCAGFRNQYDFAFNTDGELFTYDSDMEWDWGMPWYRAARVNHCVSGAEFGWRSGTGKWPDHYPDSVGAIDIGIGCPTGVAFGTGAKFPVKYQRAFYIMDWTFGRLIAVHLKPDGASYTGEFENFICPLGLAKPGAEKRPLNLTDMVIGNDGAMYFSIGGRNTASGLYRVTYSGTESTPPAPLATLAPDANSVARSQRRQLEAFHGKADPLAVDFLWPHLNSPDRALRYAARVALEWQPVAQWKGRALAEQSVHGGLTALLALVRSSGQEIQADVMKALGKFPLAQISEPQQLDKLRVAQLSFIRQGRPASELAAFAIEKLSPHYPNQSERVNRELAQLLIFLGAPDVVGKTLRHMATLKTQEDLMHYVFHLRTAKHWTLDQRREYFSYYERDRTGWERSPELLRWFAEAGRAYSDGSSFAKFLANFRREAVDYLSEPEKSALASILATTPTTVPAGKRAASEFPQPQTRAFVKEWKTGDVLAALEQVGAGRSFEKGRQAFVDAQCLACHRFGNEGGGAGPDLTAVASRFSRRDILEATIEPRKVVSEQFQNTTFMLKNGDDFTGRVVDETADKVVIHANPFTSDRTEIKKSELKSRAAAKLSPMPDGLVNSLSREEILDLIAFMESAGRRDHSAFAK